MPGAQALQAPQTPHSPLAWRQPGLISSQRRSFLVLLISGHDTVCMFRNSPGLWFVENEAKELIGSFPSLPSLAQTCPHLSTKGRGKTGRGGVSRVCSHTGSTAVLVEPDAPFRSPSVILSGGCVGQLSSLATSSAGASRQCQPGGCSISITSRVLQVLKKPGSGEW